MIVGKRSLENKKDVEQMKDVPTPLKQHGQSLVILLAGGDKRTQHKDIKTALRLAKNL